MDSLISAIRTRLNDTILTGTVAYNDITASYNPEIANYPCVVLSIIDGGDAAEFWDMTRATLQIDVYSRTNKLECYTIYDRIKVLLNNQPISSSSSTRRIVLLYEVAVNDSVYDIESDAWHVVAVYQVCYHTTSTVLYSAANGYIYADESNVTRNSTQIGAFRGAVRLLMSYEYETRAAQERFVQAVYFMTGEVIMEIEEVLFAPSMLNLLWGVTLNASDTLADGSTSATSYAITQSAYPRYLQLLFRCNRAYDAKAVEIEADKAVCQNLTIPMGKRDVAIANCRFHCFGDTNENIIKFSVEN